MNKKRVKGKYIEFREEVGHSRQSWGPHSPTRAPTMNPCGAFLWGPLSSPLAGVLVPMFRKLMYFYLLF